MRANDLATMIRQARQVHDRSRRREVGDVERNAAGIFQRLGRPKRVDIGKSDQLKRGGRRKGRTNMRLAGC